VSTVSLKGDVDGEIQPTTSHFGQALNLTKEAEMRGNYSRGRGDLFVLSFVLQALSEKHECERKR